MGRGGNSVLVGRSVLQDHRTLFAKRSDLCVWLKASLAQIDRVNRGVAAWFLAALAGFCLLRLMFGAANDLLSRTLDIWRFEWRSSTVADVILCILF